MQVSSQVLTDDIDVKLHDELNGVESDEYGAAAADGGSLRFFISSAAAAVDSPLAGPLLHKKMTASGGLDAVDASGVPSSCDAVIDFTALVSPSKVSIYCCTLDWTSLCWINSQQVVTFTD